MTARRELVARIAKSVDSMSATGQMVPQHFAMETDLTLPQIRTLYMLASSPARIADISQAQGMARPNASNMVERLVRKGLVERLSDPNDRRVALACLTDKGREAVEGVTRSESVVVERIVAVLSIDELEAVARALEILHQGVERLKAANGGAVAAQGADH